jgi:hypothetical protein
MYYYTPTSYFESRKATFADDASHAAVADVANELSPEAKRGWEDWIGGLIPDPSGGGENDGGETIAGAYEIRAGIALTAPQPKDITFSPPFPNNCIAVAFSPHSTLINTPLKEQISNISRYGFTMYFSYYTDRGAEEGTTEILRTESFSYVAIGN